MMGLSINNNIGAMNALSALNSNTSALNKALQQLSTGKKINSAADNAAGYAISQKMQGQINGLNDASQNAQDGISMIQTASGALSQTTSLLQNMRDLATQASNSTTTSADRADLQTEFNQLASQINNIGNTTQFNTQDLLNGGITQKSSSVITNATAATLTAGGPPTAAASTTKLTVDNQTFDLSKAGKLQVATDAATNANNIAALGAVTSGSTKLSDLVNITSDSKGDLIFTTKATGSSATMTINGSTTAAADAGLGLKTTDTITEGKNATMQQAGLQATDALNAPSGTTGDVTISNDASFKISVGTGSAVTVNLNNTGSDLTFKTSSGVDQNADNSAMDSVVNTVNAALQQAGLSGQVTASLGSNENLQLISTTGKDLTLTDGSVSSLANLGFTGTTGAPGDWSDNQNVQQVIGPGAEGSGFNATFQIGANTGQTMQVNIGDMRAAALGITGNAGQQGYSASNNVTDGTNSTKSEAALDISTTNSADKAISVIDNAIQSVTTEQANLGAVQNRLQSSISNLSSTSQNLTTAESGITDTNMAATMSKFTQDQVLQQAAVSMLAQANQQPQLVLKLLQ